MNNISIIGLPASGKTSYIAALWAMMIDSSPYCSLSLESLKSGNQAYLNKISEDWLSFKPVGRTMLAKNLGEVIMNLKHNANGTSSILNIPDFFGEMFDGHFKDREWSQEYHNQVRSADSFIVFIDPQHNNNIAGTIMQERIYMAELGELEPFLVDEVNVKQKKAKASNPKVYQHIDTSNQVKIVEILQFLNFTGAAEKGKKIAFILSKWDKVQSKFPTAKPEELIKRNLPLLYQYLECNGDIFNYNFFGVSAQGLEYEDTKEVNKLAKLPPQDRVIVVNGENQSKDIASPITWLME